MKRHPALQDLSRDHFHVLFRCQRLRRALANADADLRPLIDEFLLFFDSDMSPHFEEEDRLVVPLALTDEGLRDVGRRTVDEHKELRDSIAGLRRTKDAAALRALVATLEPQITEHVHMEEAELFEGIQARLTETALRDLGKQSAEFRRKHRAPEASGPRRGRG